MRRSGILMPLVRDEQQVFAQQIGGSYGHLERACSIREQNNRTWD